ncbi:hypothetical protein H8356DRAFT_1336061 [Neocallimastix lanati (nom. inval.)]|nr:hypothetical protein H8356DRAFT_1336061 [Neocallimastix sp. JGI-2020a]
MIPKSSLIRISILSCPYYIDIHKQVFKCEYNLNLPYIENIDLYLGLYNINNIKENFNNSLKNIFINDLIYDKVKIMENCEYIEDNIKDKT